jgi:hypothetical protein
MVDKVASGEVFSEYFSFPYQFSFHRLLHTHLPSGAGTIGQLVADVPSGFSVIPSKETKKKNTLRMFENRVLRRIFGPKRDEVIGGWRKLHNGELHNLYSSPSIIRMIKSKRMTLAGHVGCTREKLSIYRVLVGKPEGKRPPGRS